MTRLKPAAELAAAAGGRVVQRGQEGPFELGVDWIKALRAGG